MGLRYVIGGARVRAAFDERDAVSWRRFVVRGSLWAPGLASEVVWAADVGMAVVAAHQLREQGFYAETANAAQYVVVDAEGNKTSWQVSATPCEWEYTAEQGGE